MYGCFFVFFLYMEIFIFVTSDHRANGKSNFPDTSLLLLSVLEQLVGGFGLFQLKLA